MKQVQDKCNLNLYYGYLITINKKNGSLELNSNLILFNNKNHFFIY
ncbi:hypothetical protein SSDC_01785 [Candidatus Profftella armatura]|uniref:Uncharacterized protein n=1 Tax=Candidatus Profftella armatura TaxID=669502 RepID=S5RM59_9PROT|nr:hypothetical protein SSDC_01785 [Candidatus Profftella armatura]